MIRHGVNAELAIFPNAGHFPSAAIQQIEVHRRLVDWFVTYLKP
jgi:dipeptidyl aminopeptidase/acylaminoacyl peptidase